MSGPLRSVLRWWQGQPVAYQPDRAAPAAAPPKGPPWHRVLRAAGVPTHLVYPSTTLSRLLDQTADRFGHAIALTYKGRHWTYQQLLSDVNRIAGGLAQRGIRQRDRVLLALPNSPEFVASFMAIQKLGAVAVNVGPLMGPDDLIKAIAVTTPQVAIGLDLRVPMLVRVSHDAPSIQHWIWSSLEPYQGPIDRIGYRVKRWYGGNGFSDKAKHVSLVELMNDAPARPPTLEPQPDDIAVLQPTGGTTGGLKLAQLSHRNLLANAMQVQACSDAQPGQDRILAVLPMFHAYGLTTCLTTGIFSAAQIILLTRFDAAGTLAAIREHAPTIFPLVPAICDALCDHIEQRGGTTRPLKGIRLCLSGAAPLSRATADRFRRIAGARVLEGYGLTEASPVTHANMPGRNRLGTIGVPLPDTQAKIVQPDEPTRELPPGEPGEMLISGPQVMAGYFGDPEQNRGVLSTDPSGRTWLHTGDIATMDRDGYFRIVDRKKDMINCAGMKVYPSRVEQVLAQHEAVKESAVFGRFDPVHSEQVVAAIVPKTPVQNPEALFAQLKAYCRQHLAPYEVPHVFELFDALPRTPLGKVLKTQLRKQPPAPAPTPTRTPSPEAA
jgi:long-chain acyl-CoA synthetase